MHFKSLEYYIFEDVALSPLRSPVLEASKAHTRNLIDHLLNEQDGFFNDPSSNRKHVTLLKEKVLDVIKTYH